jgi:hypothetical protein
MRDARRKLKRNGYKNEMRVDGRNENKERKRLKCINAHV